MSYREIGQVLSIPEATAKTYFNQARKPLRTLLEPEVANGWDLGGLNLSGAQVSATESGQLKGNADE